MVELFEQDIRTIDRHSSKGNQLKWNSDRKWYKADFTGYEGLSEYVVSHLLKHTSLGEHEYVIYNQEQVKYKRIAYNAVESTDFTKNGQQIVTLERLFKNRYKTSLYETLWHINDVQERFNFLVDQVVNITGIRQFSGYLNKLFTIDAFFLNEDRHMHNIAVILNQDGTYELCPIYDNGACLLSDTRMDYPLGENVYDLMNDCHAKTISQSFDEQLDISEAFCHENMRFSFTQSDVKDVLDSAQYYTQEEKDRVEKIILRQMSKYRYLFQ